MDKIFEKINMKIISLLTLCAVTSAHEITQLQVPLYADPRRPALLSCHFRMDDQKLHSVKFYREMNEIFRYNPSQKPSIRLFNLTDIMVQDGECTADSCMVKVMPPPVATMAVYTCEVSTEGPKFQIARKTKHMNIVAMPQSDPVITGAQKVLKPLDQIFLNCSSDYSLPPSSINWYIDDELQKPDVWQRTELSPMQPGGLQKSWRVLRFRVPPTVSGALRVRCEAVVKSEPPVVKDTTTIITVHSTTQISKYVSNSRGPIRVPPTVSGALLVHCEAVVKSEPPVVKDTTTIINVHSTTQISKYVSNSRGVKLATNAILLVTLLWTFNEISRFMSL